MGQKNMGPQSRPHLQEVMREKPFLSNQLALLRHKSKVSRM